MDSERKIASFVSGIKMKKEVNHFEKKFLSECCFGEKVRYVSSLKFDADAVNGNDKNSSFHPVNKPYSTKIFCDPVHKHITLHPVCVAIIDTPEFQRLRHIKQTGFTEYVFPGSCHNRFGHSLGVCYLAGKFLQELRERQPELKVTDIDILCVQLAGLCHDLGHGPYSHSWEKFMRISNLKRNCTKSWKHEYVSANVLVYLIESNNLYPVLEHYGIGKEEIEQIQDYIIGAEPRSSSKAFLHQVVNNDDSGLDVDKWDYFLRDCLHLGLPCSFEYERLTEYAKVFYIDGRTQICFRDKVLESVYNVFRTRSTLHRLAYQHKVTLIIEQMFIDAFLMADGKVEGINGEVLQFWQWSMDAAYGKGEKLRRAVYKFCNLTDDLVHTLLKFTSLPELKKASELINAVDRRSCKENRLYQHIGLKILHQSYNKEAIFNGICKYLPAANEMMQMCGLSEETFKPVSQDDICVLVIPVNWGKGSQNPVEFVHFYSKSNTFMRLSPDQLEVSVMLPKTYEEIQVHVLCRRPDKQAVQVTRWCFEQYWSCVAKENNSHL